MPWTSAPASANCRSQDGARFLDYFAAGGSVDAVVGGFDVASGEQPAIQAAVMDEQDADAIGRQDEATGGDVSGSELSREKG